MCRHWCVQVELVSWPLASGLWAQASGSLGHWSLLSRVLAVGVRALAVCALLVPAAQLLHWLPQVMRRTEWRSAT